MHRPRPPSQPDFLGRPADEILSAIVEQQVQGVRATSGTSLSFFLDLEGDVDAAFKPYTSRGQRWYGEVVAYRIGRLLAIDRIPPAATRTIRVPVMQAFLRDDSDVLERFEEQAIFEEGHVVRGAVIYWVPTITRAAVDRAENLERWTRWLRQGAAIPPDHLTLAQQLSETIVFDYVTGNWDRWSGHNVLLGPDGETLLIMDNNAAFNTHFSEQLRRHLDAPLAQVERFSAGLYRRLVGLDGDTIRAELALDPGAAHVLDDAQIAGILERRDDIIARIEALERDHGHDAVLCFP